MYLVKFRLVIRSVVCLVSRGESQIRVDFVVFQEFFQMNVFRWNFKIELEIDNGKIGKREMFPA